LPGGSAAGALSSKEQAEKDKTKAERYIKKKIRFVKICTINQRPFIKMKKPPYFSETAA
jgi:hypothetical protein